MKEAGVKKTTFYKLVKQIEESEAHGELSV